MTMWEDITLISPSNEEFRCTIDLSHIERSDLLNLLGKEIGLADTGDFSLQYQLVEENRAGYRIFRIIPQKSPQQTDVKVTKLLVLVHGIGADETIFWGSTPMALKTDPDISASYDVKFWGYPTSRGPILPWSRLKQTLGVGPSLQSLEQLGQHLWSELREWNSRKYGHIKLFGHSMGGLVIASAVGYGIARKEQRDSELIAALRSIAFVATPLGGAKLTQIYEPIFRAFGENVQVEDLKENSAKRKEIVTRFINVALISNRLPLTVFRATDDSVVKPSELTAPLCNTDVRVREDTLSGEHSKCIQNLEVGQQNLRKIVTWVITDP